MRQLKITKRITVRESVALDKYLNDISKIDMLTGNREAELAVLIREGSQEALEELTSANLRFVVSVAKQYQNQGLSLPDLINEGNVGLLKAAKRFDETKGFKFISYAVWWIRQSILAAIVEYSRLVRLPINKVNTYNKLNAAVTNFNQQFEREPSEAELADLLDIKVEEVAKMMSGGRRHLSTDAPVADDSEATMLDLFVDNEEDRPDMSLRNRRYVWTY